MTIPFMDFAQFEPLYGWCNCLLCTRYDRQISRLALHVTTRSWYGV